MKNIFNKEQLVKSNQSYMEIATRLEKAKVKEVEDKITKVSETKHKLIVAQPDYSDKPKVAEALKELDVVTLNLEKQLQEVRKTFGTDNNLLAIAHRLDEAEKYNQCKSEVNKMSVSLQTFADNLDVFKDKMREAGLYIVPMQIDSIHQSLGALAGNYNYMVANFMFTDKELLDAFNRLMAQQEKIDFVSDQQKIESILKSVKEL